MTYPPTVLSRKDIESVEKAARQAVTVDTENYQEKRKQVHDRLLAQTVDQLYQETLRKVMTQADEVMVLIATEDGTVEWRPQLSRDATIGKKKAQEKIDKKR